MFAIPSRDLTLDEGKKLLDELGEMEGYATVHLEMFGFYNGDDVQLIVFSENAARQYDVPPMMADMLLQALNGDSE